MYAVFKTGGKQYRASTGDVLKVEKIEAEKGATLELDQVLMVGEGDDVKIGTPYLKGGKVTATVIDQGRGKKTILLLRQATNAAGDAHYQSHCFRRKTIGHEKAAWLPVFLAQLMNNIIGDTGSSRQQGHRQQYECLETMESIH